MTETTATATKPAFNEVYAATFGTIWTKFKRGALPVHPWDSSTNGQIAYAFNALADANAYPVLLIDVPDRITQSSQVRALRLDIGGECKVYVGQLLSAKDAAEEMVQTEGKDLLLELSAAEVLKAIELSDEYRADKSPKAKAAKEEAAPKEKRPRKSKGEAPAPGYAPEVDPFAEEAATAPAAETAAEPDPFAEEGPGQPEPVQVEGDIEPEPEQAPQPAAEPAIEKGKKGKAKKEDEPEVPNKAFTVDGYAALKESLPDLLHSAEKSIRHARIEKQNGDPIGLLRTALSSVNAVQDALVRLIARGSLENPPTMDRTIAVPAASIAMALRNVVVHIEANPGKPKTWDEAIKDQKSIIKRCLGLATVLKEAGVDPVQPPKLRTEEGVSIENVE